LKDILERRIQTKVLRKGLARSARQARQFITHRHITVGLKEITSPSYLVSIAEEEKIAFKSNSALTSADHPERLIKTELPKQEVIKTESPKQ